MLKKQVFILLAFLMAISLSYASVPDGFSKIKEVKGITEYRMDSNELSILMMEDHSAPVLTFMVTYRVGSRNEVTGTTGATHILEHLMFKGTEKYNKANDGHIDNLLGNIGAMLNANTWTDRTCYFESIPSNYLELAIDIESDRMRNLLLREEDRDAEMTVVRNEYEQNENDPYGALDKEIWATAFQAHPYHHSTIGWRSDIENVPIPKLREFYNTFYWPNNTTVTVIGDFNTNEALALLQKYFGQIERSPNEIPKLYTEEPIQEGPRRILLKRPGQLGVVGIGWKIPPASHQDIYALSVLKNILQAGKSSRFYKALIDKNKSVNTFNDLALFHDPSLFITYSFLAPGITHDEVEKIIHSEIDKIKISSVTTDEVKRAINQISAETAYDRDGSYSIASQITEAIAMGDWTLYVNYLDNIQKVTADDVQRVAKEYFIDDHSTTGYFVPVMPGDENENSGPSSLKHDHSKFYYRTPGDAPAAGSSAINFTQPQSEQTQITKNITRTKVNGIDLITAKTGVKDVFTFRGSLAAGDVFNKSGNDMVADLTGNMLDKGTTKNDKFQLAEKLENLGASIRFGVDKNNLTFRGQCLKKDIAQVIDLLAEQLRYPAFSEEEFVKLKTQREGSFKRQMEDTDTRAEEAFERIIFNPDHPNYNKKLDELIGDIKGVTLDDIKNFHKTHYGPKSMIFVATGDIDNKEITTVFEKSFKGWQGGVTHEKYDRQLTKPDAGMHIVTMEGKTAVSVIFGQTTSLKRADKDYLPFTLGSEVLGGYSFTARLMSIIRDEEGLTYGIYTNHSNDIYTDGDWYIGTSFAPQLLDKGLASTQREFKRWADKGITQKELDMVKSRLIGEFKVRLVTTAGMASQILSFVQRGFDISYMDEYPELVQKTTLSDVNAAIKKYIDPDKLIVVVAGSVDEHGKPLTKAD